MTLAISRVEISETLAKIRALSNQPKVALAESPRAGSVPAFNEVMNIAKDSISEINHKQLETESLKKAYLSGDPNTSIAQVMTSTMQSKLAFEGLLVVRNKLLDSYKEIMNMPI